MAAKTGRGSTPLQNFRYEHERWEALGAKAAEEGLSASEVLRRLAYRYTNGEIKAGPAVPPLPRPDDGASA